MKILGSASKLILLYVVGMLGLLTAFTVVWALTHGDVNNELVKAIVALYGSAVTFVMGFYFGSKGEPTEPFAGK